MAITNINEIMYTHSDIEQNRISEQGMRMLLEGTASINKIKNIHLCNNIFNCRG